MMKKIILIILALFLLMSVLFYVGRSKIKETLLDAQKQSLPEAVSYNQVKKSLKVIDGNIEVIDIIDVNADLKLPPKEILVKNEESVAINTPVITIPEEFNLDIPFSSQAPYGIWDEIHKEACEETSSLMAARFVKNAGINSPGDADSELLKLVDWQQNFFGFWKDTDAEQTATMIRKFYGLKDVEVKYNISLDDIKKEIAQGNPVIIPAAGRLLGNPYYTPPGPYYHMLVVRGYTKDKIITNDPGTKHGENYAYKNDIFYNAIHDWNSGDVANGKKVMIIVK